MIKVFIPTEKRKYNKPLARGFWRNDNSKIYYDYITIKEYTQEANGLYYKDRFFNYIELIKASYNQEAVFYVNNNIGNIYFNKDNITILPHRLIIEVKKADLRQAIREALKKYNGCTVYLKDKRYFIEVFTTI